MNFEKLIIDLHILIIFFMFMEFQENKKLIVISSIKCLNFNFL